MKVTLQFFVFLLSLVFLFLGGEMFQTAEAKVVRPIGAYGVNFGSRSSMGGRGSFSSSSNNRIPYGGYPILGYGSGSGGYRGTGK